MKERIRKIISNKTIFIIVYVLLALTASFQSYLSAEEFAEKSGTGQLTYKNYTIFERSFHHLIDNKDLYIEYPDEYWDLYKYTPTFSAFFGLFAIFPDWLGVSLWDLLNALVLLFAVYYLPRLDPLKKGLILLIVMIELLTALQNEQSNGLIAGLMILSFGLLENKNYLLATLLIVFSAYIKLFGIFALVLFLFYPQKWKLALYTAMWSVLLFLVPLIFIDLKQYTFLFQSYFRLLNGDHINSYGYSVMGWLKTWFDFEPNKDYLVLAGLIVFLIPFTRIKMYRDYWFRYLVLASALIWVVIFNHKAESPTFIIAMAGVALWFIWSEKNALNITLFVFAFILTTISPTDLFPRSIRLEYVNPYALKAVPCILIWLKITYDMLVLKSGEGLAIQEN